MLMSWKLTAISNPAATVVLEAPVVESKTALMPSIGKEIDDALDAVRVDLHQEARQRDEMLAHQFEQELGQSGQSILEFEASIANPAQMTPPEVGNGELELDDVQPHIGVKPPVATAEAIPQSPNFAIKPSSSKSWLPILILVLLAVLAGVYFWFWG